MNIMSKSNMSSLDNLWYDVERLFHRTDGASIPPHNISHTDYGYMLEVFIPSFDKKDVTVEQEGKFLVIRGNHNKEDKKYKHKGYVQNSFEKKLYLRDEASISEATIKNGVLTIPIIVKQESEAVKKIEVK